VDPARPRVGTPIRNGCRSVTDCHKRREVYKGAPSLLRVPASEHAARVLLLRGSPEIPESSKQSAETLFARWDFGKDLERDVLWLRIARRALRPDGTLWMTGTHHIIFSLGLALHRLGTASVMSNLGRSLYGEASTIH
jgi:hypothetical protein